ncbi:hypothetical protein V6N12_063910 [Hibiscus sabdariffa]|uniref:START domain-containing protein n=2 Tax=Hibiscus sabdariffa TaxID=183260 RepID=A0ABR2ARK6_9ROSI
MFDMTHKTSESELMGNLRDDDYEIKSGTETTDAPSGDDQDPNQRPKKKRYHRHTQRQIQEMEAYKEALSNATCPSCGGPAALGEMSFDEQHLRIENARLKEEIDRISGIAAKYVGKPLSSFPHLSSHLHSRSIDLGASNFGTQSGFVGEMDRSGDLLRSVSGPTEADKPMIVELAVAAMEELIRLAQSGEPLWVPGDNSTDMLNKDEYLRTFPRGIGPKPLGLRSEASRESAVVIMNHVNLVEILMDVNQWSSVFCGIVSRAMTLEVLSTGVAGNYNGALQVCTSCVSDDTISISYRSSAVITSTEGRKSMLKLAERMVTSFCTGVGASTAHAWTTLSATGSDDVRVMTRKSMDDPGRPPGIVLSAATSFWIPVPPKRVFDFLRDENSRSEWDILSNGGLVQEMAHIANGRDPGNCVSLLRVNSTNSSQSNMLILQESCTDATGSYVIYAPVDIVAMNVVLSGGDPDYVALLPSGFAILPDGPGHNGGGILEIGSGGSLLTVAFQILVDSVPTAKLSLGSVATVNSLIKCTVERIKAAVNA